MDRMGLGKPEKFCGGGSEKNVEGPINDASVFVGGVGVSEKVIVGGVRKTENQKFWDVVKNDASFVGAYVLLKKIHHPPWVHRKFFPWVASLKKFF